MSAEQLTTSEPIGLLHGPDLAGSALLLALQECGMEPRQIGGPDELAGPSAAMLLLDSTLLRVAKLETWRQRVDIAHPGSLLLAEPGVVKDGVDLILPAGLSVPDSVKIFQLALTRWVLQRENRQLQELLGKTEQDLQLLTGIGIALSAEKDLDHLLDKILAEAQNLACCDAASLFQMGEAP